MELDPAPPVGLVEPMESIPFAAIGKAMTAFSLAFAIMYMAFFEAAAGHSSARADTSTVRQRMSVDSGRYIV